MFALDTEGLSAIVNDIDKQNEDRKNFDSKLIIVCLAVSQIVIVNAIKNFDAKTHDILKLCNDKLINLNIQDDQRPEIVVVLNQNTSTRTE